jgi:4-amino-4-deoxy-L-arabinose transferase-like glycosyltransferase
MATDETRGWFGWATILVAGVVTWCVVSTYTLFSHTVDEPTHIAAGMEWLERGTQELHSENPPLARVAVGLGAHLAGHRLGHEGGVIRLGTEAFYADGTYLRNLARARAGTLPFFLLSILLVWSWTRKLAGARAAFVAAGSFASLPPMMAHAGLATTDVAFVATFLLALFTCERWLEAPTPGRSLGLGVGLGLALITKFSTLLFFPPCALAMWSVRWISGGERQRSPWKPWVGGAAIALVLGGLFLWAAYGFSVGTFAERPQTAQLIRTCFPDEGSFANRLAHWVSRTHLPAPGCLYGLLFLAAHGVMGSPAYLFSHESVHGWWYFYPVAMAVKTPLPFLILFLGGLAHLLRRSRERGRQWLAPAAAALAFVLVSTTTTINIGLRHALAVYPLMAISLGLGVDLLLRGLSGSRRRIAAIAVALCLAWQAVDVIRAHPNYLASFNALAGSDPGRILVDSDLDWGQDALQLEAFFKGRAVDSLSIAFFGSARLCELDLPALKNLEPGRPVTGWIAISEMYYRDHWRKIYADPCDRHPLGESERGAYAWLRSYEPVAFAGRSIRIYHILDE